jgi:hypothetical protein
MTYLTEIVTGHSVFSHFTTENCNKVVILSLKFATKFPWKDTNRIQHVRFQVLRAVSMKIRGFWDVVLEFIALMMEVVHTSETSVYSEATWRYILSGSNL